VTINIGTRFPAHCTSMGRVLLAWMPPDDLDSYLEHAELRRLTSHTVTSPSVLRTELDRIRSQGWAMVDQELEEGLRSIAVPLRERSGRVTAAMNISSHASRTTVESARRDLLPPLLAAAARVEADLHSMGTAGTALSR
jgi:IclR family transcriptional regulator, pca regulon regulatory protein